MWSVKCDEKYQLLDFIEFDVELLESIYKDTKVITKIQSNEGFTALKGKGFKTEDRSCGYGRIRAKYLIRKIKFSKT